MISERKSQNGETEPANFIFRKLVMCEFIPIKVSKIDFERLKPISAQLICEIYLKSVSRLINAKTPRQLKVNFPREPMVSRGGKSRKKTIPTMVDVACIGSLRCCESIFPRLKFDEPILIIGSVCRSALEHLKPFSARSVHLAGPMISECKSENGGTEPANFIFRKLVMCEFIPFKVSKIDFERLKPISAQLICEIYSESVSRLINAKTPRQLKVDRGEIDQKEGAPGMVHRK